MGKKNQRRTGIVYSSDPDFEYRYAGDTEEQTGPNTKQKLYISLDRKNRRGKEVTLIEGFRGSTDSLKELGKLLKSKCGSGGAAKDGEILIQGNHVTKVLKILLEMGYSQTKTKGGGF